MSSEYRHKSNRYSPFNNRMETNRRNKYDRESSQEEKFRMKGEKRRTDDSRRHNRSDRYLSYRNKIEVKEEIAEIPSGKWKREEKYKIEIPIKTEPISDEEMNFERKPANFTADRKPNINMKEEKSEIWGHEEPPKEEKKEGINMALSGKLTEDANTYNGVVIRYSQPPEARNPKTKWRWYIFKGDQEIPFLPLHRQSAYLIGKNRQIADIPIDHPSCSKQHAVLQYRLVTYTRTDDTMGRTVKPYIIDLESANGTYINTKRINARQYYELFERDVVKFGFSSREYVLLHEGSKDSDNEVVDSGPELSPVSLLKS